MCKITKENDSLQRQTENKDENSQELQGNKNIPELRFPEFEGEWDNYCLEDICSFSKGKGISKKNIGKEGIDCICYGELYTVYNEVINKTISKTDLSYEDLILSKKNDVIIPSTGETAIDISQTSCITKDNVAIGGDINILKSKENGIFLSYSLNNNKKNIAKLAQGSTIIHLYADQLKKLIINVPSMDEQEKISNFINILTRKIELMEKTLKQNIKEKTYYLQNLFPNENKIPLIRFSEFNDNWQIRNIKEVLNISGRIGFRGYTQKDFVKKGEGALTIGAKHITSNNKLKLVEPEYISWNKYYESPEIMIQKGDILLSKTGTIGKVTLINKEIGEATINPNLVLLNDFKADRKFLYYLMSTYNFKKELLRYSTTTSVPMINQENINNISIKIPSHDEQIRIVKVLTTIDRKIDLNNKKLNHLKQFKKGLLQKMFC